MINRSNLARSERFNRDYNKASMPVCRISFFLRVSKRDYRSGTIYVRLKIKGHLGQLSTGISIADKSEWDSKTGIVTNDPNKTRLLIHLKHEIETVYMERYITDRSLDPDLILKIVAGLKTHDEHTPTVIDGLYKWIDQYKERVDVDIVSRTLKTYEQYVSRIKEFLSYKGYSSGLTYEELKPSLAAELILYLKKNRQYSHNYAVKIVQFLRSSINYAIAYEWTTHNPLAATKLRKEFREIKALTEKQVQSFIDADFVSSALDKARDIFVFQCFTGLAYADVRELSISNLCRIESGDYYIEKPRKKTSTVQFIPILEPALAILSKYQNDSCRKRGLLLPVPSNQKLNQYLKEIQDILGINEKMHTHLARKTCTTLFIINGVPQATTCKVMGYSLNMMEKHYLSVRKDVIMNDVRKAFDGKFKIHRNDSKPSSSEVV